MFYKYENNELTYGPYVLFPNGVCLHPDTLDQIELPYENWHYFDTEKEAKDFFGIKYENLTFGEDSGNI